ncbi:hypothetical protein Ccrd_010217, partial [Cynara cardunculus var. scolymus]
LAFFHCCYICTNCRFDVSISTLQDDLVCAYNLKFEVLISPFSFQNPRDFMVLITGFYRFISISHLSIYSWDLDTIRVLVDRLQMDCLLHLGKPQNSPSISNFSVFKTSRVTVKKVAPKGKAAKDPNKPKRPALAFFVYMFNLKKLTYDERKQKLIERLNALNVEPGGADDE